MNTPDGNSSLLEAIRGKECSMTRRLAEVREKAAAEIEEAGDTPQEESKGWESRTRSRGDRREHQTNSWRQDE